MAHQEVLDQTWKGTVLAAQTKGIHAVVPTAPGATEYRYYSFSFKNFIQIFQKKTQNKSEFTET